MSRSSIVPRGPFSLEASARFLEGFAPAGHAAVGERGHLHLVFVPDGRERAAGACVREEDGAVVIEVVAAEEPDAARRQVERMLSLDVDAREFPAVGERDPVVGRLQARFPGLRPPGFASPFEAGVWFLLAQRVRMSHAAAVSARLRDSLGERVTVCGEERVAFPAPVVIAGLQALPGVPERKLANVRALAYAALGGALDGERLRALGGEAAAEELQRLPGVGPFTAQGIVIRGAGEPDLIATAEPRLARAVALAYGLAAPPTPEDVAARAEAWRPFRSWVTLLLRAFLAEESPGA
jgi:DNA-3-methyladenine glycosylase II